FAAWRLMLPDTTPPTVSITAPTAGTALAGTVTVAAGATDDVGVVGVQFKLDGASLGSENTTAPYRLAWNTTGVPNGSHTLSAVARDAAGNTAAAAAIIVTNNDHLTADRRSGEAGCAVCGTITVAAAAADDVGVVGVQFKLDSTNLGPEDTSNTYSIAWDTTTVSNGSYTLTAVARDAAGNTASAAVTVTVNNDLTPPVLSSVAASAIGPASAAISWTTDELADSQVEY